MFTYEENKCPQCGFYRDKLSKKSSDIPNYAIYTNNPLYAQILMEKHQKLKHPVFGV